jgi:hypothetical protein
VIQNAITANQDGTYNVRLYMNGAGNPPTTVKVSPDNLPLANGAQFNGDILNGKQEIWPNLIEKAIIQAQGGKFQNKSPMEFMTMLTGQPSVYQDISTLTPQKIANNLKGALDAGNPAVVWTPNTYKWANTSAGNVRGNHAYTVTSVDTKNMTVNLRNPWGGQDLIGLPISELQQHFTGISINQMQQQNLQASIVQDQFVMPAGSDQLIPEPTTLFTNMNLASISPSDPVVWPTFNFADVLLENYGENGVASLENYDVRLAHGGDITLSESGTPLYTFNHTQNTATMHNLVPFDSLELFREVVAELESLLEKEQSASTNSQIVRDQSIGGIGD